ncbi:hypothetical protein ACVBEQ_23095 [Nakamurella sp. GG22]
MKKTIVIASVAALTIGGAGVAFAYWTSTGTGVGEAQTGQEAVFTITSEDAVGEISPGSPGQTIDFTVTNPGPGTLLFSSVTVRLATANGIQWVPTGACNFDDYTATISDAPDPIQLAAAAFVVGEATVTLANTAVSQDDCQGQTVPLYFEASSAELPL